MAAGQVISSIWAKNGEALYAEGSIVFAEGDGQERYREKGVGSGWVFIEPTDEEVDVGFLAFFCA